MKYKYGVRLSIVCLLWLPALLSNGQENGWTDMLDSGNLDAWIKLNGDATYELKDGVVTGIATYGTPNTFLATRKSYGDFILELEVYDDPRLNSGIQIRSQSKKEYNKGRVHGYQVEIDPSPRAYSGGIYDEARRGWLATLAENDRGRKAFVNGEWNVYRIEAIGKELRVWINGINTANVIDAVDSEGFIALQVHSIGDRSLEGAQVKWRNIRIKTQGLAEDRWPMSPDAPEYNLVPNTLSEREKRRGWRLLFDGNSNNGWRSARSDEFPKTGWHISDGILTVLASDGGESTGGGDIITNDKFSDFELKFEFRMSEGANSGIKYYVDPEINKGPGSSIGLEYQILDDQRHPDAKQGVNGNRTLASLYDLIPASNLSVPNRSKPVQGIGKWNRGKIISKGNRIEHWLNAAKVVEYERNTQIFRALVAYSKYKIWPSFGELNEGHILLQDHGNEVSFRNVKIREL
ncbi:MAG: DUF1080 domain-containing protein [Rhodothermales bacterium]|nr:DUF1080 domain-containing protein [Rhodothermales bacterium]